jgi:hypothetical protein
LPSPGYLSVVRQQLVRPSHAIGISGQERYRALQVLENLPAIEKWRDALDDRRRRRLNHPGATWHSWQRATKAALADDTSKNDPVCGKPVFWSQDHLRRTHEAMLKSRSTDLLVLAGLALQAAIRSRADLVALLPDDPPEPAPPRRVEQGVAA